MKNRRAAGLLSPIRDKNGRRELGGGRQGTTPATTAFVQKLESRSACVRKKKGGGVKEAVKVSFSAHLLNKRGSTSFTLSMTRKALFVRAIRLTSLIRLVPKQRYSYSTPSTIEVNHFFFLKFPQFGSLRTLSQKNRSREEEKKKNATR